MRAVKPGSDLQQSSEKWNVPAALPARLRHWQLLGVTGSSSVQLPEGPSVCPGLKRPRALSQIWGEQGRAGGRGLTLLLREEDQTLNTHKHIIKVFKSPHTYSFLHHLIPGVLCCSAPTQGTVCSHKPSFLEQESTSIFCFQSSMIITFALHFSCGNLKSLPALSFTGGNQSTPEINTPLHHRGK